jgi:hypothetical protein
LCTSGSQRAKRPSSPADASPALGYRRLTREALDVGQDQIAATVNTLDLAYVGASLPILLIFTIGGYARCSENQLLRFRSSLLRACAVRAFALR